MSLFGFALASLLGCAGGGAVGTQERPLTDDDQVEGRKTKEPMKDDREMELPRPSKPLRPSEPRPEERRAPPGTPGHLDPRLLPHEPEGAIDITPRGPNRCIAQLELRAEVVGDEVTLRATLSSNSDESVKVTLNSPCPGGPVAFSGLGEGYDYYGACSAGACREARAPLALVLPAGRRKVEVAATTFSLSGDACRPRLPGGTHAINGSAEVLSPKGATICGSAYTQLTVPEPEKKRDESTRRACPPGPVCGLACPGGRFARDKNGCSLCACDSQIPEF